jgi:cytosine/adenosine deaminase-related metal-dependent hydrolase
MQNNNAVKTFSLEGEALVTPKKVIKKALKINNKKIEAIGRNPSLHFVLRDTFVFPALINLHDHLRGDYLPRVGPQKGTFYLNWAPWDKDLKASPIFKERSELSVEECYHLGAYKNLFSGVCTVNDHFPHEINDHILSLLPIRVIRKYTLAHECSSYDLQWGDGIEIEHDRAHKKDYPFITHLEEGYDEEAQRGVEILEELRCLDSFDILIHCIGFSDEDIKKAQRAGVTVGWCPASNIYMYNLTCKIKKMLEAGINVALGTDSTHTGSINLLEEMRFGREIYRKMYGEELDAKILTDMVTVNPAKAFRMAREAGSLEAGKNADVLAIQQKDDDPYESLLKTDIEDIALLLLEGNPILAHKEYEELFHIRKQPFTEITIRGRHMLVKGDPRALLKRVREAVGHKKVLDFMPIEL